VSVLIHPFTSLQRLVFLVNSRYFRFFAVFKNPPYPEVTESICRVPFRHFFQTPWHAYANTPLLVCSTVYSKYVFSCTVLKGCPNAFKLHLSKLSLVLIRNRLTQRWFTLTFENFVFTVNWNFIIFIRYSYQNYRFCLFNNTLQRNLKTKITKRSATLKISYCFGSLS